MAELPSDSLMRLTGEIVASYVGHNSVPVSELASVISTVADSLKSLEPSGEGAAALGAVGGGLASKSITQDYIVCLEDGRRLRTLKRHLRTAYAMTPEQYRAKWGLPRNYPMVAPSYAAYRSRLAKKIGLGRKGKAGGA